MDLTELSIVSIKTLLIYVAFIHVVPVMIWVERKGAALIQDRPGPNRVGPFGLFQPIADAVKFLFKEDPVPKEVNRLLYNLGPFLILLPSSLIIAAIPVGDRVEIFGRDVLLQVADIDVALLFFLSISSLGVYGILFGGWASNNKYSLLGAMRSSSQVISYEIPIALAAANAVMFYGTFSLRQMVLQQEGVILGFLPNWGIWFQPIGFLVLFVALFAETNRLPFDLPESEAELVGGYHTEYGSMKFATFFMAEYINLATASALLVTLFFGGWHVPWLSDSWLLLKLGSQNLVALVQVSMFVAKVSVLLCIFVWVRWTVPRFRFDQLMHLAWGNLIPLGLANIIITAILLYFFEGR
ncbi:MAG: NADH-quinone oxidoreductase subunit NuoH [Bdellovibrionaceae bacterium]|nr:NADH-quinone oxidoreductase subunit NuoH [Bdellovibrionales bacterium]MCB9253087.1 NADH-quinone oxidoreductase subunit NuoH [Pseudobdellovibrionaceae bacterium]